MLITAIGVSLLLEYGGQYLFGADPKSFPDLITDSALENTGALTITRSQIIAFGVTVVLLVALSFIVKRTKLGLAMRALSNNPTAATLMGVNLDTVISFTFGLGSALAGAAGILWSIYNPSIDPLMGVQPGIKAFVAAVLGGIGNIPGAAVGGLLIGVVETFVAGSRSRITRDAIAFAVLIVILLFRPAGLLGQIAGGESLTLSAPLNRYLRSKKLWLLAAIVVSAVISHFSGSINGYYLQVIIFIGINIILAVSLNLINGYTGQFSLGHAGFMAIGAYVSAYLSKEKGAGVAACARRREICDLSCCSWACSSRGGWRRRWPGCSSACRRCGCEGIISPS